MATPLHRRAGCWLVLALLQGLSAAAPAQPRLDPAKSDDYRPFLRGGTAIVYRHKHKPVVAKLIAKEARPPEEWVSYPQWLADRHGKLSARDRALVARESLRAYLTLKQDPALRDLLPRTWSPAPGRIDQRWVAGRDWDQLSPQAQQTAMAEMVVVVRRARNLLPGQLIDEGVYNFKFDRAGHVRGGSTG